MVKLIASLGRFAVLTATLSGFAAPASSLSKVELRRVFPALTLDRPVWMEEAPDGSGRFFIVEPAVRWLVHVPGQRTVDGHRQRRPHAFIGDAEANTEINRQNREPWKLPV